VTSRNFSYLVVAGVLLCLALGEASDNSEKTAKMQLVQISGGEEFTTNVDVQIGNGNHMTIDMPGRENIIVEYARRTGGIIKFAVTDIEMGKLHTMHFIGTGSENGKLVGDIIFIEDGRLQDDISGRFFLDDVFDW
jgi:hypothetical protein